MSSSLTTSCVLIPNQERMMAMMGVRTREADAMVPLNQHNMIATHSARNEHARSQPNAKLSNWVIELF